ncbi:MAG: hypothetical protein F6K21_33010 [Symploca sp. SIO2D2]|nr:hypothetical protein [Symploca sp. SIO2D2]
MYTNEQIRKLFGTDVLSYLANKNRGGISGEKGNTYENFFAVYQLALRAQDVIENKREINFYSQIIAFVDDLIIACQHNTTLEHYQLKNRTDVIWGSGQRSITDDFRKQHVLNQSMSRESLLHLVVSSQELSVRLKESLPTEIKAYSQVIHFPYESSLVKVIEKQPDFRKAIEYLCAFENPAPDKIECVAAVLLGAWVSSDKSGACVMEILKKAQQSTPSFIRSFSQELQLDPEVENILNKIESLSYNLTKGFLHWEYSNGLDQGTLPYSIDSDKFTRFQELLKRNNPTSFEELEAFLI